MAATLKLGLVNPARLLLGAKVSVAAVPIVMVSPQRVAVQALHQVSADG
jgi:hypothetical protein